MSSLNFPCHSLRPLLLVLLVNWEKGPVHQWKKMSFKTHIQTFLFLFEYQFLFIAGPHSDRTVPVRAERIQWRGDIWWRSIPGCQSKLPAGRLRAERWIVELTGYELEDTFFSCNGCCIANAWNLWILYCGTHQCAVSSVWLLIYTEHTWEVLKEMPHSLLINSQFQCHHWEAERHHSIALLGNKLLF